MCCGRKRALKARRTEIETLTKRLTDLGNELRKDSPEYKQLDADLTRKKIDLSTQVSQQKKEFLEKEAKIYYNVYQEVLDEVQYFSERNRISLVLRFNGDPVTDSDPQEILKQLNKRWSTTTRASTSRRMILDSLNTPRRRCCAAVPGGQAVPGTGVRPGVPPPVANRFSRRRPRCRSNGSRGAAFSGRALMRMLHVEASTRPEKLLVTG